MALQFHLDEHVADAIAEGLSRRGINVTTTAQAGLLGDTDLEHLKYAHATDRVIYTNDPDFLQHAAAGVEHCGIAFSEVGSRTIGQVIEMLALMHACFAEEEMRNRIEFI